MTTFTDRSKMPFGIHAGKELANVPASYLLHLRTMSWWDASSPLGRYVTDNLVALEAESKNQQRKDNFLKK